ASELVSSCFFSDPATTAISTLSLHDALPICTCMRLSASSESTSPILRGASRTSACSSIASLARFAGENDLRRRALITLCRWLSRSEEHTSELQSRENLVCRLLLEKKKQQPPE